VPPESSKGVTAVDLNTKLQSNQLVQKVAAFEVIADSSGTMNDGIKGGTKMGQQKALLDLFDRTIPNLKLNAAERAFGQFTAFGDATSKLVYGPTDYAKGGLTQAAAPLKGYGFSPLDAALDGATADLKPQSGQLAVIAFSDGEDMEKFDPVAAAQRMKSAYGDRVCIYTVHLGDNANGQKVMQKVADAGACGFMVKGADIASPAGMADFVEKVFLKAYVAPPKVEEPKPVVQEVKPQAQEAPKVVEAEPEAITLNIQFATGKWNIQKKYHNEIKRVSDYMAKYPDTKAVIEGHTDNVGKAAANLKLSKNRANSVKKYLVSGSRSTASRWRAVGYGEEKPSPSNKTKEGRQKNRRVTARSAR
jgi:OOP family OmpA-OmpF porin